VDAFAAFSYLVGDMPGDRFAFAIGVGGEIDIFLALGGFLKLLDNLLLPMDHMKVRREVIFHVDPQLALRQIDDMPHRRLDLKILAQIFAQGLGLGRRFDDD